MDQGTKIYSVFLGVLCSLLAVIFFYEAPKVKELNNKLESISIINDFPYQFKVLRIENGTATLNSPVSTELPCGKVIGIIFPSINGKSLLSAEYQKAQYLLAEVQTTVKDIIESDPKINKVNWELDKQWLIQNGVSLNNY